jgi:hypothetical protein
MGKPDKTAADIYEKSVNLTTLQRRNTRNFLLVHYDDLPTLRTNLKEYFTRLKIKYHGFSVVKDTETHLEVKIGFVGTNYWIKIKKGDPIVEADPIVDQE